LPQVESPTRKAAYGRIQVFEYHAGPDAPLLPEWNGWGDDEDSSANSSSHARGGVVETGLRAEFDQRLAEETRRSFEAGRERGRQEGRQAEHDAQAVSQSAAGQERARQATELIASVTLERDRFLQTVEHEVVKLALAVAARILRREAQMDPLLLTGAVRVALGQLSGSTQVKLRVPPAELELWTDAIALVPNLAVKPAVIAGEGMRLGDCVIETEMGSVDLGIRSQLGEIERGFFDRAGGSKASNSSSSSPKAETAKPVATEPADAEQVSAVSDTDQEKLA
jgi:flagellar assembly protein FliH